MEDITQKGYNKIYKTFIKDSAEMQPIADLNKFLSLIRKRSKRKIKILDLGCAGGRDTKFFVAKGYDVIGIDFSKEMIKYAKKHVPEAIFYKMSIEDIDFSENSFNGVWANASFQHIKKKDLPNVLRKVYKSMTQGGIFFLDLRVGKSEREESTKEYGAPIKRFFAYYSEKEITNYLKAAGFKIIKIKIFSDIFHGKKRKKIRIFSQKSAIRNHEL